MTSDIDLWKIIPLDWRRPGVVGSHQIFWDRQREYGQVLPRPDLATVASFYEVEEYYTHKTAAMLQPGLFGRALRHLAWRRDKGIEPNSDWWKRVLGNKPLRILEVGCGDGSNMRVLSSLGHEVVGVEPDTAARVNAHAAGFEVYAGTAETLPAEVVGKTFDVVFFMHVLEHCLDPEAAIQSARSVLNEGGKIVAEVPNNACLGARYFGSAWYWLDVPRHLNFFTAKSLSDLVGSVSHTEYRGYVRQFAPDWIAAQARIAATMKLPRPRSYWLYLLQTAFAPASRKYDSVRVVGVY